MRLPLTPLLLAALLGLSQCKHKNPSPAKPEDQLLPATQTGAGTFGCLLNGQPWTPSGGGLFAIPNFLVTYDPSYHGGNLAVTAYRNTNGTTIKQSVGFGGDQINQTGNYLLTTYSSSSSSRTPYFSDGNKVSPCDEYLSSPGTKATGQFVITRLDKAQGIISGTFSFTLSQPGCDTIKVTQGRFDSKF